ncbi:hypothetical protein ACLB2K_067817 [Fragaria x ananassa]
MVEAIAIRQHLLFLDRGMYFSSENLKLMQKKKQQERHCHYVKALSNLKQQPEKDNQKKPLTLHHSISTDAPLYESSKASFDQYMVDEQRVLKALFPGIKGSKKHNKKEWRIQMPTMQFLFMSACLVIYINFRYKSKGKDYPPHVSHHISIVIEIEATRWELEGLPDKYRPRYFSICVKGPYILIDSKENKAGLEHRLT